MLTKLVYNYRHGHRVEYIVRGILALAVPGDNGSVAEEVMRTMSEEERSTGRRPFRFDSGSTSSGAESGGSSGPCGVPLNEDHSTDDEAYRALVQQYGVSPARARKIPPSHRIAVVKVLEENPSCCISMDGLLENGRLVPNTVVLFQTNNGSVFAYLFSKPSIDEWFSCTDTPTNPLTRDRVDMRSQYLQLS
jgi:hypothetical protein